MTTNSTEPRIILFQLVTQTMPIHISMGQIVASAAQRGTPIRDAPLQGTEANKSDSNILETKTFGATKTLEDALDTLDQIAAAARGG